MYFERFWQCIRISEKNLEIIRERDCSSGKSFESNKKNVILANGSCQIYTLSPSTPPQVYFLGKVGAATATARYSPMLGNNSIGTDSETIIHKVKTC